MKKVLNLIFPYFLALLFLFFSPKITFAAILFSDDFNDGNADNWVVVGTPGWNVVNGEYGIFLSPGLSDSIPSDNVWDDNWKDYTYEVDLRGVHGVDKNIIFRYKDPNNFYEIHHNADNGGTIYFERHITGGSYRVTTPVNYPLNNGPSYHFKFEVNGKHFKIYVNRSVLFDADDNTAPLLEGKIGLRVGTGAVSPSEVWYDNVVVRDLEPEPSPTPTPIPTPTPLPKIILIPGLGASWNREKILFGTEVPQSAWKIPPWFPHYNNLIEALENAGYQKNEDLFIFAYDWTKPVDLIADDLKNYIDNVVDPPPEEKINIVSHSLGGLVGRAYIQENPSSHKVNKLITLGSPHKGAPQVYKAWEGAELHDLMAQPWRLLAELLLAARGRNYQNRVVAIRNLAPVLRDLLPVFDYLIWEESEQIILERSLPENSRNLWLWRIGTPRGLLHLFATVVGTIGNAPSWLWLTPRDKIDEILGRYPIGKPVNQENSVGDRMVLASSARLLGAYSAHLSLDHGDLVQSQEGIDKILELLGIEGASLMIAQATTETQSLVFALTSLDNLKVTGPNGEISLPEEDNIVHIPNPLTGEYEVEVTGKDSETYQLIIGHLTEQGDIWTQYEGKIVPRQMVTYTIPIDNTLKTTPFYLIKHINEKLTKLISEIDVYKIDPITKAKIKSGLLKIWGELKLVDILLHIEKNDRANNFIQKAISTNTNLLRLAEKNGVTSLLPPLRELQDLLDQLHDFLEK